MNRTSMGDGASLAGALSHLAALAPYGAIAPLSLRRLLDGIFPGPVLDAVPARVGGAPVDPERVDGRVFAEIHDDPLRVIRVVFEREPAVQVRVALPERARVAIRHARKAVRFGPFVVREAAAGERVSQRVTDHLARLGGPGEVAPSGRIAPGPARVPEPRLDVKLGVRPVRHRAPPRGQDPLERWRGVERVGGVARKAIDPRAESEVRGERPDGAAGRGGHANGGDAGARWWRRGSRALAAATAVSAAQAERQREERAAPRLAGGRAHPPHDTTP